MTSTSAAPPLGRWTRAERARLGGIVLAVAALHVAGWSLYLYWNNQPLAAGGFAGAGTLAYALGVRHAFDADHIAAIDDTTRLMLARGRRPVGVGFFFALHIRFALPLVSIATYPEVWLDRYTEETYALRDPIIAWGFSTTGSGRWSEIRFPDPYDILGQAKAYGMVFGMAVSTGPIKSRTIASIT